MYCLFSDVSGIYLICGKVFASQGMGSILTANNNLRVSFAVKRRNQYKLWESYGAPKCNLWGNFCFVHKKKCMISWRYTK